MHCGAEFYQNRPNGFGDIAIFRFSRWLPSAIWNIYIFKFLVTRHIICIAMPNFIKIGQMVAELLHLTFFKMAAILHLGFSKFDFSTAFWVRMVNMHQYAKFRRNRSNCC